ncbi:hydrogenase maturation protein HypF [Parelusimicrobium proximum]|uniref:carbamoyltransferase HypF n=1 Tax=Parelusimicrobium proximum TaxID=3228953 RepID=UPI003D16D061
MLIRKRLIIRGVVQGVGFRPFVYKHAAALGLSGYVRNTSFGVEAEAEGDSAKVGELINIIHTRPPAIARVDSVQAVEIPLKHDLSFSILFSAPVKQKRSPLPPDTALCAACASEIADPKDRRYRYPLTNCTDCGPRYTIAHTLPYDRSNTTMSKFKMCPLCQAEYDTPADRRFHAEPNACPVCGPKVILYIDGKATCENAAAIEQTAAALTSGQTAAIKSIGGYHLACDAENLSAVMRLRKAKNRPDKPFALMFASMDTLKKYCHTNAEEERILLSAAAPIVMLKKKLEIAAIADRLGTYGAMLPFTPLHKILFDIYGSGPLVMTSANEEGESIIADDAGALAKLSGAADVILTHEREIANKIDDSIVFELDGKTHITRLGRGLVPKMIRLPFSAGKDTLCYGAEKTGTFCLTTGNEAFVSQYLGDLNHADNQKYYLDTLKKTADILHIHPEVFARDKHPQYFTSELNAGAGPVQHHAAHALSVACEHDIKGEYLAVILDGTGYGDDGTAWGGEFLLFSGGAYQRAGHFDTFKLIGGDLAAHQIWRLGLSLILKHCGSLDGQKERFKDIDADALNTAVQMYNKDINSPVTSSMGRLFDAAAFFAGLRSGVTYQAQAAMELEALFDESKAKAYPVIFKDGIISAENLVKEMLAEQDPAVLASRFHAWVADAVLAAAQKTAVKQVVLSGGCCQNKALLRLTLKALKTAGFTVYTNLQLPCNDSCIALGQTMSVVKGIKEAE